MCYLSVRVRVSSDRAMCDWFGSVTIRYGLQSDYPPMGGVVSPLLIGIPGQGPVRAGAGFSLGSGRLLSLYMSSDWEVVASLILVRDSGPRG